MGLHRGLVLDDVDCVEDEGAGKLKFANFLDQGAHNGLCLLACGYDSKVLGQLAEQNYALIIVMVAFSLIKVANDAVQIYEKNRKFHA